MASLAKISIQQAPQGKIATITITNEAKLNIMNSATISEVIRLFETLEKDEDLVCVVLTGAGNKAFIGGADISEMVDLTPQTARTFITHLHNLCLKIRYYPVPVIARINGYCIGAGMEIAASCDISIAVEDAIFAMPEVQVGMPSVIEAVLLPKIIGLSLARDLLMTGRQLSAKEALGCNLIHHMVPATELDQRTNVVAASILSAGRNAVRIQKELCNIWENSSIEEGIEKSIDAYARAYETNEPKEMLSGFLKRKR
jgi:enoyl-CoA hydratase